MRAPLTAVCFSWSSESQRGELRSAPPQLPPEPPSQRRPLGPLPPERLVGARGPQSRNFQHGVEVVGWGGTDATAGATPAKPDETAGAIGDSLRTGGSATGTDVADSGETDCPRPPDGLRTLAPSVDGGAGSPVGSILGSLGCGGGGLAGRIPPGPEPSGISVSWAGAGRTCDGSSRNAPPGYAGAPPGGALAGVRG